MRRLLGPAACLLILTTACSVDVDGPASAGGGRYQMVVVDGGEGVQTCLLLDSQTGALYERDDDEWVEIVDPLDE